MAEQIIGFIGAGNMAHSLVGGMIAQGVAPARIWMSDPDAGRLDELAGQLQVQVTTDNAAVAKRADVLVLAVKPQMMQPVCEALKPELGEPAPLVVSIAAGVTVANLQSWLGEVPVVRCMPNTPALVRAGTTGLYAAEGVTDEQKTQAEQILGSAGLAVWFDSEQELDAVTAVSGSGPAYFFLMMESLIEAAKEQGLAPDKARQLVLQTARGAAELAITSEDEPDVLRRKVTSPGGTTAAALEVLEDGQYRDLIRKAVAAARKRSEELSG